ncbi:hypothetical protein BX600DRAFT_506617 [Xylariales sp. PMI_506]|nr:hypothetical protein BX600DRAFT_506617 [Xylariales sp. PMI_506]
MHALWSRVSQAESSCRCRLCLKTATGLVRRSTTAASRRRVSPADIFTACYTTILGTAAVLDATRKDVRRKELDDKLERARASLTTLAVQEAALAPNDGELVRRSLTAEDLWSTYGPPIAEDILPGDLPSVEDLPFEALSFSSRRPLDWHAISRALIVEESKGDDPIRDPKDQKQLSDMTEMVDTITVDLMRSVQGHRQSVGSGDRLEHEELFHEVSTLRQSFPCYENPHIDMPATAESRSKLNGSLRNIFNRTTNHVELVAKICRSLLLSHTLPNIHNYNTLIAEFHRIRRPDLAQVVVDAYLDLSQFPATQGTIICLLGHARQTHSSDYHDEIVQRMRGAIEDGLHYFVLQKKGRTPKEDTEEARKLAAQLEIPIVGKAPRSIPVFECLIEGFLHFGQYEHIRGAILAFLASFRGEHVISAETLVHFLSDCVAQLDRNAARALFKGLANYADRFEVFLQQVVNQSHTSVSRRINDLLHTIVDLCGNGYIENRNGIQRSKMQRVANTLNKLTVYLDDVDREIQEEPPNETKEGLRATAAVADSFRVAGFAIDTRYRAAVHAVCREYTSLEERFERIVAHIKFSTIQYYTRATFVPLSRIPPVDWNHRGRRKLFDVEFPKSAFWALRSIRSIPRDANAIDIKSQLIDGMPDADVAMKIKEMGDWTKLTTPWLISFYHPNRQINVERLQRMIDQGFVTLTGASAANQRFKEIDNNLKAIMVCELDRGNQFQMKNTHHYWRNIPFGEVVARYMLQESSSSAVQRPSQRSKAGKGAVSSSLSAQRRATSEGEQNTPTSLWAEVTTPPAFGIHMLPSDGSANADIAADLAL